MESPRAASPPVCELHSSSPSVVSVDGEDDVSVFYAWLDDRYPPGAMNKTVMDDDKYDLIVQLATLRQQLRSGGVEPKRCRSRLLEEYKRLTEDVSGTGFKAIEYHVNRFEVVVVDGFKWLARPRSSLTGHSIEGIGQMRVEDWPEPLDPEYCQKYVFLLSMFVCVHALSFLGLSIKSLKCSRSAY